MRQAASQLRTSFASLLRRPAGGCLHLHHRATRGAHLAPSRHRGGGWVCPSPSAGGCMYRHPGGLFRATSWLGGPINRRRRRRSSDQPSVFTGQSRRWAGTTQATRSTLEGWALEGSSLEGVVRRLPREAASHGPTYAIPLTGADDDGKGRRPEGAVAHLRFLAYHGCGRRFTVLYKEAVPARTHEDDEADDDDGGGFDAGELEAVDVPDHPAGRAGGWGHGGSWRVRLARGGDDDGLELSGGGAAKKQQPALPPRVVSLDALDGVRGEQLMRLARFDDDLGDDRLYRRSPPDPPDSASGPAGDPSTAPTWSAARAAPRWPAEVLATLDATGGAYGDDALVCVDGGYFVELIELSAFPTPVLFPHGAWRLRGLGPGLPNFHAAAEAARGAGAVEALRALASEEEGGGTRIDGGPGAPGRLTGELPGRGRVQLGGSGGDAGVTQALQAVTHREVKVTFGSEETLGIGFAPLDWAAQTGAQVWEVDEGSAADRAGVRAGMVFTSVGGADVTEAAFADIDAAFDGPRPLDVTFDAFVPGAERLYAVEMVAGDALAALAGRRRDGRGGGVGATDEARGTGDGGDDDEGADAVFRSSPRAIFEEPARAFDGNPAVVWREEPSTLFVGDPGSATVVHHDIIGQIEPRHVLSVPTGQIELCHVLSGAKLLAAAPWGASSEDLLAKARGRGRSSAEEEEGDGDDEDDGEEEEGSVLSVPVHRDLEDVERELLLHPGLSIVHARPGDAVAFSSAATHFATNGSDGPCAAVFHGVLTPASAHVLAAHPARLDPFSDEEREEEGFDGHLTGRALLEELLPAGSQVLKAKRSADETSSTKTAEKKKRNATPRAKGARKASSTSPRFTLAERGIAGEAAARRRFEEAVRRMDEAVRASSGKNKRRAPAPSLWSGASSTTFYVDDANVDDGRAS